MNTIQERNKGNSLQGNLLRLNECREIAIYLREGAAWVADFNDGRGELFIASAWYSIGSGRMLVNAQRRNAVETISPLPDEVIQRIESLHRRMEEPTVDSFARKTLAALAAWLRRWSAAVTARGIRAG